MFTVQTLTFRTLYVLLSISYGRRELVHVNVIPIPPPPGPGGNSPWGRTPRHRLRDRDAVSSGEFRKQARRPGIRTLLSPARVPRTNAVAERVMGTLRRECSDHFVGVNERHLRAVLARFVRCYNAERPHRTLRLETPVPATRPSVGPIRSRAVLGGYITSTNAPPERDRAFPPPHVGVP